MLTKKEARKLHSYTCIEAFTFSMYNISVYLTTVTTQLQENENMQALNTISKLNKIAYG